jgi:hypothetical protein
MMIYSLYIGKSMNAIQHIWNTHKHIKMLYAQGASPTYIALTVGWSVEAVMQFLSNAAVKDQMGVMQMGVIR